MEKTLIKEKLLIINVNKDSHNTGLWRKFAKANVGAIEWHGGI